MNKIIAYDVITVYDHTQLINQVNEMIEKGWQPFGSLQVIVAKTGGYTY